MYEGNNTGYSPAGYHKWLEKNKEKVKKDVERVKGKRDRTADQIKLVQDAIAQNDREHDEAEKDLRIQIESADRIRGALTNNVSKFFKSAVGELKPVGTRVAQALKDRRLSNQEVGEILFETFKVMNGMMLSAAKTGANVVAQSKVIASLDDRANRLMKAVAQLGGQHSWLVSTLAGLGILPTDSVMQDIKNGAVFVRGYRVPLSALVLSFVMVRGMRLYTTTEDLIDSVIPTEDPALIPIGARVVATDTAVLAKRGLDVDMFCIEQSGPGPFPVGSHVIYGREATLGLPIRGAVKTGAIAYILSYKKLWLNALAFATELVDEGLSRFGD